MDKTIDRVVENDNETLHKPNEVLSKLKINTPGDKSERARQYAESITEMEKVYAHVYDYFKTWVIDEMEKK